MTRSNTIKLIGFAALAAILSAVIICAKQGESDAAEQSTDDAYVRADMTLLAPQVSGRVEQVLVQENQVVRQGQLLAEIDDRDFVLAVQRARADLSSAAAAVDSLKNRLAMQDFIVAQAAATLAADAASLKLAQSDLVRYRNLAADGSGTVQSRQRSEADVAVRRAAQDRTAAALEAEKRQHGVLGAELAKAVAAQDQAQSALELANLTLSYTKLTSPIDGTIGQRSIRTGGYVTKGGPALAIVPLQSVYIEANYRETQLARVRPGQAVEIRVDAAPGRVFQGRVESLGPATGVSYSPIAPHNATGNFTKITQRLPIRIAVDGEQFKVAPLRVGMSVQTRIRID